MTHDFPRCLGAGEGISAWKDFLCVCETEAVRREGGGVG